MHQTPGKAVSLFVLVTLMLYETFYYPTFIYEGTKVQRGSLTHPASKRSLSQASSPDNLAREPTLFITAPRRRIRDEDGNRCAHQAVATRGSTGQAGELVKVKCEQDFEAKNLALLPLFKSVVAKLC